MLGSVESESPKRTESDGWHLVWILEEGDSVFARVKVDSELLMATAIAVNLYVGTICGLVFDLLKFWETKEMSTIRS